LPRQSNDSGFEVTSRLWRSGKLAISFTLAMAD
jgi:hypothetical protein